uniref:Uncharacterized protein n=1 Tax=Solanum tuberosum TaxID=4113 RepID=M1CAN8_SOLTU
MNRECAHRIQGYKIETSSCRLTILHLKYARTKILCNRSVISRLDIDEKHLI